ncbi:CopG family ribbon-helix-helix protein [Paraburkholderia oxyphila]|uniref:CopG family ribbon-helix-helix protein n=1 Tax=Paraburkholderia oxyphila TaxID=614212 RepID=UPI000486B721|nr:ribbon-helix-helix protein, CopG family [Paraburkholderia oxyphila]
MAISIKLDDDSEDLLQRAAGLEHCTLHAVLREAIAHHAERVNARERFKQEALASWRHYNETGKHLRGDEVRAWMRTWGTEDERAVPDCHD